MPKKPSSGAAESNAGDDFHVLWAVKRSFELLNFEENGLKAIVVEDVEFKDNLKVDPEGNQLLGVDITEYYGGENFADAEKVIVSQLKHSTRGVKENWNFSNLYKGKKSGSKNGSLIHRLAQIYYAFLENFGRDLVLEKLSLNLISNRNFSPNQKQIILNIQHFLNKKKSKTFLETVYKKFPNNKTQLEKLQKATNLKPLAFVDFLRLLDFNDCGTGSRFQQEQEIINALHSQGINRSSQIDALYRKIWKKMMPESRSERKITEIDFLQWFETSLEKLFPISQDFEVNENVVERKQLDEIIKTIKFNKTGKPICLHGGAGIGKSILSQLIKKNFLDNSEVILFDCYGAGSYLNPSDSRHLHKEAILQISNEMAKRISSPFLLTNDYEPHLLIRELKNRIENAVNILRNRNEDALLVLIVDAADNSVTAAQKDQTKSFIQDLLNENYVDGFRLIVTSRSHRRDLLKLPENNIDIPLKAFDLEETEKHLKFHFPESANEEVNNFHELTNGIPRVQTYALDLKSIGIEEVINYLKPNGKTVEDLIEDKIIDSVKKVGENGLKLVNMFFTYLITMPRPVPINYLSILCDVDIDLLIDLSTDIWHGLILHKNNFSFRDEDFENYVRDKYSADLQIHQKIADLFLDNANKDEYSSINLGVALHNANYTDRLIDVVLNEEYRKLPVDPIREKEVYIQRTKLAMKVSCDIDDKLTFFKLAFVAADAAKTDVALSELLLNNADLVASFGKADSLERLHLKSDKKSWSGSFHYQLAAIYSRNQGTIELAKMHLDNAEKWLRWWLRQRGTATFEKVQISYEVIAFGAEAYLRIHGLKEALRWLIGWKPKKAVFIASNYLIENILKHSTEEQISTWLESTSIPLIGKLIILDKLNFSNEHSFRLSQIANIILRAFQRRVRFEIYLYPLILSFCELFIHKEFEAKDVVLKILEYINVELPDYISTFSDSVYFEVSNRDIADQFLRKRALISLLTNAELKLKDIYPEKFKNIEKDESYETKRYKENEKKKFDRFYKHAISVYLFRIDVFANNNIDVQTSKFINICTEVDKDSEFRYYEGYDINEKLNFLSLILLDVLPFLGEKQNLIEKLVKSFEHKNQNRISIRIAIAAKISTIKVLEKYTYNLLDEIDSIIHESTFTSSEMVEYYLKSSRISPSVDKEVCRFYFNKAVDAVSEIDVEAQEQIRCIYSLSKLGIPKANPNLAFQFAKFVEYCERRLSGYDNFPISEGIQGITYLDCATAFAVICRWQHKYVAEGQTIANITQHIFSIHKISLEKGFVSASVAGSMLPLNIHYFDDYVEYIKILIDKFDAKNDKDSKSELVKNILRDIQIACSNNVRKKTVTDIYNIINNGKFIEQQLVQEFKKYYEFINTIHSRENERLPNISRNVEQTENFQTLKDIVANVDICSTSSLNRAVKEIMRDHFDSPTITHFFKTIKNACEPENYIQHLDALINVNPDTIDFYYFENALKERLTEWDFHPLVKNWKEQNFSKTLKIWFVNFKDSDGIYYGGIKDFADIFSVDELKLAKVIFEILPEKIDELSATALYETITFLGNRLNPQQNEELISWTLQKWNAPIRSDFNEIEWDKTDRSSPHFSNKVIAKFLRFILGCPDKRIRWRGIHTLRRIVNAGNIEILRFLLEHQNEVNCNPFQYKDNMFFWISAKLYLWICIERLSNEKPNLISQLREEILMELQNSELPHVLIVHFVKETCLNLHNQNPNIFTEHELQVITNTLKSPFPPLQKKAKREYEYMSKDKGWKFKFNTLESLPYWFRPIGRCFNLSEYEVADWADKYISENWGYVGDPEKDNHVNEDYYLSYNRKGDLPKVERLKTYFEYHSMYCAAMELLKTKPLQGKYDWRNWDYWLEGEALTFKNLWLSDLNDPIPLKRKFWISDVEKYNEKWRDGVKEDEYDEILGLKNDINLTTIVPYGGYTIYIGENYESASVNSAIVSPQSSEALLRALQTAKDSYDYRIPLEEDNLQINEDCFQLLGWLKEKRSDHSGLDKHDPFLYELNKNFILFGKEVEQHFEINYSKDFKKGFHQGVQVLSCQNWSNETNDNRYYKIKSSGFLLKVDIDFLLKFLKKNKMDLLIECTIRRFIKDDYSKEHIRKNNARLYLIKSNGEVKTIRGRNYTIG